MKRLWHHSDVRETLRNTFWLDKLKQKEISDNVCFNVEYNYGENEEQDYKSICRIVPHMTFSVSKKNKTLFSTISLNNTLIKDNLKTDMKPNKPFLMNKLNLNPKNNPTSLSKSASSFINLRNNNRRLNTAQAIEMKKLLNLSMNNEPCK